MSAFGGNQFQPTQKRYLDSYFSLFYLSINIGSTIGTLLTPVFRSDIKCFGNDCYPLAFGVPAAFMLIAIIFFVSGTSYYRRDNDKAKGSDNIIGQTIGCMFTALKYKFKKSSEKKPHWLDYAEVKYTKEMISYVKTFCKIIAVFLPLPVFWALYDQQGSRWTSQAQQLNGRIGTWTIKPDQFQAINPVFILIMVPVFDIVIYPLFSKCGLLKKQLQRMSIGLIFAIIAFLIAGGLEWQMQLKSTLNNPPKQIRIVNLSPCDFQLIKNDQILNIEPNELNKNYPFNIPKEFVQNLTTSNNLTKESFTLNAVCLLEKDTIKNIFNQTISIDNSNLPKSLLFYYDERKNVLNYISLDYNITDSKIGLSEVRFTLFNTQKFGSLDPVIMNSIISYSTKDLNFSDFSLDNSNIDLIKSTDYLTIDYADYTLKVSNSSGGLLISKPILLETCGRYTVILFPSAKNSSTLDYVFLTDVYPNGIHIAWQIIQIFVMTMGELMFAISGLSFAYSQAPAQMKSVIQATWLLTVAFGNLIVVFVAETKFIKNQVYEYLLFSGLLAIATFIFMILSWFYKYETYDDDDDKKDGLIDDIEEYKDITLIKGVQKKKMSDASDFSYDDIHKGLFNKGFHREITDSDVTLINIRSLEN